MVTERLASEWSRQVLAPHYSAGDLERAVVFAARYHLWILHSSEHGKPSDTKPDSYMIHVLTSRLGEEKIALLDAAHAALGEHILQDRLP